MSNFFVDREAATMKMCALTAYFSGILTGCLWGGDQFEKLVCQEIKKVC